MKYVREVVIFFYKYKEQGTKVTYLLFSFQ
jgi:hypothetical protein